MCNVTKPYLCVLQSGNSHMCKCRELPQMAGSDSICDDECGLGGEGCNRILTSCFIISCVYCFKLLERKCICVFPV